MVGTRAIGATEYVWAGGFALMLNRAVPFFAPAGNVIALMALIFVAPLAIASAALKLQPAPSTASMHNRTGFASL
jgi:hypothetical protein